MVIQPTLLNHETKTSAEFIEKLFNILKQVLFCLGFYMIKGAKLKFQLIFEHNQWIIEPLETHHRKN